MKLLLDECVPHRLVKEIANHETITVAQAGFKGLKNGELLQAAADHNFDALISVDQNLAYHQNLRRLPIAVVIMRAKRTKYETLAPLVPQVLEALQTIRKGNLVVVADVSA
jgi:predicted nuclease of predicted toxin-antitoxin system